MANPTNPFNWQMPTSTDLVTDLPADFEVFGQAVATSMADLLGGTTGQVLAKASNTDMDFSWVAQDDSNAIQNAIVDAKGDLIAASANDTPARLAVGANGETLVADSSTSTGLRYQPSISQNFVVNGNFDFWQRGTSFVSPSGYTADRWTSGGGLNATVAQEATTIQDGSTYSLKITSTGAGSYQQLITYLESGMVNALAGKTIVLSTYVRANATFSGTLELKMSTGTLADTTGGTWTAASSQTVTPTTSGWTRVQTSYAVPSGTKGLRFELNYVTGQASGSIVYWSQVQAEIGSVPTVFKRSGGTIQGELAACQRYYWRNTGAIYMRAGIGIGATSASAQIVVQNPVPMRVKPTSFDFSTLGIYDQVTLITATNAAIDEAGILTNNLNISVASGVTQYRPYVLYLGSASGYLGFSAEL